MTLANIVARMERSEIRGLTRRQLRIARSLSSGAHSRDPLASRNDEWGNRFSDNGDVTTGGFGFR
jgi:hypothetical protein